MRTRALGVLTSLLLALGAAVVLSAPAQAAGERRVSIVFDKNWKYQFRSQVIWKVERPCANGTWRLVDRAAWRAGSGLADKHGRNACVRNHGWLPDGVYGVRHHAHYDGTYINGRVFRLDDKRCHNGTIRQNLFIHSEQTVRNTQCRDTAGDQVCRWEWPKVNDYRSNGCIKMAPGAIRQLSERYHRFFVSGVRYRTSKVRLVVRR